MVFGKPPLLTASAPGRLEVLGNHTDYNQGLTLSCAVDLRCFAMIAPRDQPEVHLASTAAGAIQGVYPLDQLTAPKGHWSNYVLGLISTLQERGHEVPGFELLVDSKVPGSAGLSSSAALEMSALTVLDAMLRLDLPPLEMAKIGQQAEATVVGAKTGLLDPLSSLLGRANHLLDIDFQSLQTEHYMMPAGWCFVAIDSGVKHDLTQEYNDRRASCERAATAIGVPALRDAGLDDLIKHQGAMPEDMWRCARHVMTENERVRQAIKSLASGDVHAFGRLMFASHESSRSDFRNSCEALDALIDMAKQDDRCAGARLSGGGFGGITIHLVRETDAHAYQRDLLETIEQMGRPKPWSEICRIDDGARLEL